MNFNQIQTFLQLSKTLSFNRTAILMGTTQPTISRQIQELEKRLGFELFMRTKQSVHLTSAGTAFLQELKPWMNGFEELMERTRERTQEIAGTLSIGCLPEIGQNYFFKRILKFKKTNPLIQIQIKYLLDHEILSSLKSGELDFGITIKPQLGEVFRSYRCVDETAVMVTRTQCKLTEGVKEKSKLVKLPFVGYSAVDSLLNAFLKSHCSPLDISKLKAISSVNSHRSMIEFLLDQDSFAVLPYFSIEPYLKKGLLKICHPDELKNTLYLLETEKQNRTQKCESFRKFILSK